MAIPVSEILGKVSTVLNDSDFVRWTETELIGWINDAAVEVVIRRPHANTVIKALTLVDGPLQTIPSDGIQFIEVGSTAEGYVVGRIDRKLLDYQMPGWRIAKPGRTKHYMFENKSPLLFAVYPPAIAGAVLGIVYSARPEIVSRPEDSVALGYEYLSPIVSFVLYRALSKDSEFASGQLAVAHYQAFSEAMGVRNETAAAVSPNQASV